MDSILLSHLAELQKSRDAIKNQIFRFVTPPTARENHFDRVLTFFRRYYTFLAVRNTSRV